MIAEILSDVNLLDHIPAEAKLRKFGADKWRGQCPIMKHRSQGTFSVYREKRGNLAFTCFACGAHGSVIDLVMALDGCSKDDAIRRLGKGSKRITPEERIARVADAWKIQQPKWGVVCCAVPGCPTTLGLDAWADIVWTRWWAAKDGSIALCPAHATRGAYQAVVARRPARAAA